VDYLIVVSYLKAIAIFFLNQRRAHRGRGRNPQSNASHLACFRVSLSHQADEMG